MRRAHVERNPADPDGSSRNEAVHMDVPSGLLALRLRARRRGAPGGRGAEATASRQKTRCGWPFPDSTYTLLNAGVSRATPAASDWRRVMVEDAALPLTAHNETVMARMRCHGPMLSMRPCTTVSAALQPNMKVITFVVK